MSREFKLGDRTEVQVNATEFDEGGRPLDAIPARPIDQQCQCDVFADDGHLLAGLTWDHDEVSMQCFATYETTFCDGDVWLSDASIDQVAKERGVSRKVVIFGEDAMAAYQRLCDEHREPQRFEVKYYDRKLSRKGRGTQVRVFTDRAAAEEFAAKNRIYAGPCKVVEVPVRDGRAV